MKHIDDVVEMINRDDYSSARLRKNFNGTFSIYNRYYPAIEVDYIHVYGPLNDKELEYTKKLLGVENVK